MTFSRNVIKAQKGTLRKRKKKMYGKWNARHSCTKAHIDGFVNGHYIYLWFTVYCQTERRLLTGDYRFFLRTKFPTLPLSTSRQIHPVLHPTVLWSSQTTFLKTTLMWILNSHTRCGLNRRMCLGQSLIRTSNDGAEAYHSHLNAEFYVKHIPTYTCLLMYLLKKVQQTAYFATNSLSYPARISKDERDRRLGVPPVLTRWMGSVFHLYLLVGWVRSYATGSSVLNCLIVFLIGWLLKVACHRVHSWDH